MACPAINGYHSIANYEWQGLDTPLAGEETPILICGVGRYKCTVTCGDEALRREFVVSGEL